MTGHLHALSFDLAPPVEGDQQAEVGPLVSLGAIRLAVGEGDAGRVVMADPDGHELPAGARAW